MIKCFVINLDHREDRLKRIRKHLNSNGLYFTRFQAVNALETNSKTLTKNNLLACFSAIIFNLIPGITFSSFITTTDIPLILFSSAFAYIF